MSEPSPAGVWRFERKLLLDSAARGGLRRALASWLRVDPHAGSKGYRVRSLYLDSPARRHYHEKLDGVFARHKARLRVYEPLEGERGEPWARAQAELKLKRGDRGRKLRRTCALDPLQLRPGRLRPYLLRRLGQLGALGQALVEESLEAACWIVYRREAFVEPRLGLRVTLDQELRAASPWRPAREVEVLAPGTFVLEVKHGGRVPARLERLVAGLGRPARSLSKYELGVESLEARGGV